MFDFISCRKHYYSIVVQFIRVTNDLIPYREAGNVALSQETHTLCVFDQLPVVSWRRAKYKQMYGLKSTLTVSR